MFISVYCKLKSRFFTARIRGFLFLFSSIINNFGVLTAFICGAFMDYDKVPYVVIALPAVFLVAMTALPEPPSILLRQNKLKVNYEVANLKKDRRNIVSVEM